MSWKDLIEKAPRTVSIPWFGANNINIKGRKYRIIGNFPSEFGWYKCSLHNKDAELGDKYDPDLSSIENVVHGFLVGNRLIVDSAKNLRGVDDLLAESIPLVLVDSNIDKFSRVSAGQFHGYGPFIYLSEEMPIGPERDVHSAWMNKDPDLSNIAGVTPALEAVFKIENYRREMMELRREEALKREEAERLRSSFRSNNAVARRSLATVDFDAAARAALAISGSELVETKDSYSSDEKVVRFRTNNRVFECICNSKTLQIIDSGICLTDEHTGEKGDTWLTLESLPIVIAEAQSSGRLVVFRHVN